MQATTIGATSAVTSTTKPTTRGFADLNSEDFFGLLIAQLQAQDPLKPTDNQQLLSQMSSIRQMEQSTNLNKTLSSLASEQRFGGTAGLIGRYVFGSVKDSAGHAVEINGLVTGVRFDKDGQAVLDLHNGHSLPAEDVEQVTMVENLPPDVQAQLQSEISAASASGAGAAAKSKSLAAARIGASPAPVETAQISGRQTTQTKNLLDTLLSQGVGIEI